MGITTEALSIKGKSAFQLSHRQQLFFRPSVITAILYAVFLLLVTLLHHYDVLHYVHIGTYFGQATHPHSGKLNGYGGYDGQFYYFIARNPFTAYKFMDNPAYRYERIVYAVLTLILSLGQAQFIPYVLLLINFVSIVLGVEIVSRLLIRHGLSPWYSLAFGLYFGQATAFIFDTTEPLSALFVCLGLLQLDRKRLSSAAIWMALAVLARETAILFPIGFILIYFYQRRWWDAIRFGIISILPSLIWYVVLALIFKKLGASGAPAFEPVPFDGLFVFSNDKNRFLPLIVLMFIPTVVSLVIAAKEMLQRHWGGGTWFILLINLVLVACMAPGSYRELVSAGRISLGLIPAVLLYGWQTRSKMVLWAAQIYTLTFPIYTIGVLLLHFSS